MNTGARKLALLAALGIVVLSASPSHAWKSKKGYSVTPPAGWKTNASGILGSDVLFTAKPVKGFASNLNVVVTPVPRNASIGQMKAQMSTMLTRTFPGFKMLGQRSITLSGARALRTDATFLLGTPARRLRIAQVAALRGTRAYIITGTAPAESFKSYASTFERVFKSVRWTR